MRTEIEEMLAIPCNLKREDHTYFAVLASLLLKLTSDRILDGRKKMHERCGGGKKRDQPQNANASTNEKAQNSSDISRELRHLTRTSSMTPLRSSERRLRLSCCHDQPLLRRNEAPHGQRLKRSSLTFCGAGSLGGNTGKCIMLRT